MGRVKLIFILMYCFYFALSEVFTGCFVVLETVAVRIIYKRRVCYTRILLPLISEQGERGVVVFYGCQPSGGQ